MIPIERAKIEPKIRIRTKLLKPCAFTAARVRSHNGEIAVQVKHGA